ncbi:MAG: phosphoribosylglycinamide formyltransferase [Deltaproteobacteria bacterium]|nr:phosphoribosylglycinamide formyltransferase [Deltaproteobacteria bacterium]
MPGTPLIERAPCSAGDPLRLGVLVSGSGSNLAAVLDAARDPARALRVAAVLSNVAGVRALERAVAAGVPALVEDHKGRSREAFEDAVDAALRAHRVEVVVLAGFMRVLTAHFLERWKHRVLNVHPALCPAFPGMHAPRQALAHGVRVTGCTVHLVDAGVDTGPILAQAAVPVLDDDDEAALTSRIQAEEHRLFPAVLSALAQGRVRLVDGRPRACGLAAR